MKKLFGLLIGLLSCISFGSCANFSDFITYLDSDTITVNAGTFYTVKEITSSDDYGTYCLKIKSFQGNLNGFFGMNTNLSSPNYNWLFEMFNDWGYPLYFCTYINVRYLVLYARDVPFTIDYDLFKLNTFLDTQVPVMTSLECQTNYSLVPVSELNYCQGELSQCTSAYNSCNSSLSSCQSDLNSATSYVSSLEGEIAQCTQDLINCSNSSSGSGDCGSGNVQWSALYINDIQHLGKPNIFINIPDIIDWDYTSEGDDFTLNVSGYAVDTEYIEGVIAVNSYQPTSEDFTNIFVSGLTLVFPYIVIVLFIVFVRKLIKRIFK